MVERSLSMREVPGSIPESSTFFFLYLSHHLIHMLLKIQLFTNLTAMNIHNTNPLMNILTGEGGTS